LDVPDVDGLEPHRPPGRVDAEVGAGRGAGDGGAHGRLVTVGDDVFDGDGQVRDQHAEAAEDLLERVAARWLARVEGVLDHAFGDDSVEDRGVGGLGGLVDLADQCLVLFAHRAACQVS
jgi:hypothetical protein